MNYEGKYFSILGDSISTLAGYHPEECAVFYDWKNKRAAGIVSAEDTWWGKVIHALGGKLLVNHAWSGSLVCCQPGCEIESYGCSDARTGALGRDGQLPDVVMILMGLNDFGWGMPVETQEEGKNLAVFSVAYGAMLEKIRRNYPQAEICCITLPRSCWRAEPGFENPPIRGGWHFQDYCRAIRRCAEQYHCRLVDICRPEAPYDTIDGLHPTAEGMQTIADAVLEELRKAV